MECGCWKGHSTFMIASLIKKRKKNVKLHIFDSFEGLSKSTKNDKIYHSKNKTEKERIEKYFKSNENFVKNKVLRSFNFTKTYKGWIPERFSEIKNKKFSFVHVDVDLYKPTLDCLKFFLPKTS